MSVRPTSETHQPPYIPVTPDGRFVVIYTRYSDPNNQSMDSCEQQERKARQALTAAGIPHDNAIVLKDMGIRGDRSDREAFVALLTMIESGQVAVLAVDEQSRFGRGFNVPGLIQDLVFHRGRFISAGEGIDTTRPGWEVLVGFKGAMNLAEVRTTGVRVRRGMEERVLNGESAGDYPMGYCSVRDPEAEAAAAAALGPRRKPRAKIVIHQEAAAVVLRIFQLFTSGMSVSAIVRYLRANKVPKYSKGRKHRATWSQPYVRKVLMNEKYIGTWRYSCTTVLKNSAGTKKFVPTDPSVRITVEHPHLRIVPQEIWDQAVEIRRRNADIWGLKVGQRRRGPGPRPHYTLAYPKSIFSGITHCNKCDRTFHLYHSDGERRLRCPGTVAGECTVRAGFPADRAEEATTAVLADLLMACPPWVAAASDEFRRVAERLAAEAPAEVKRLRCQLAEMRSTITNLVGAIGRGLDSPAVRQELVNAEATVSQLEAAVAHAERTSSAATVLPTDDEVVTEMRRLAEMLRTDPASRRIMRSLLRDVRAVEVIPPGRVRGYIRLTFHVDAADLIRLAVKGDPVGEAAHDAIAASGASTTDENPHGGIFTIDLNQTTKADRLGPQIEEMRSRKMGWPAIARELGLTVGGAYTAMQRWRRRTENGGGPRDNGSGGPNSGLDAA
jgi:DNA invertase Pin-like site-specific DNA recombinase